MKDDELKYPIFIEASKYTLCNKNKSFFISCAKGYFPYGIEYENHNIYINNKKIKLYNEPDKLCMQLLDIFNDIIIKREENNIDRVVFEYSISLMEKYGWTNKKRKDFYSLVMEGILLKIINKTNMEINTGKIIDISSIIFENGDYKLDFENYQSGSSITSNASK